MRCAYSVQITCNVIQKWRWELHYTVITAQPTPPRPTASRHPDVVAHDVRVDWLLALDPCTSCTSASSAQPVAAPRYCTPSKASLPRPPSRPRVGTGRRDGWLLLCRARRGLLTLRGVPLCKLHVTGRQRCELQCNYSVITHYNYSSLITDIP